MALSKVGCKPELLAEFKNRPVYKYLHSRDLEFWFNKSTIRLNTLHSYSLGPSHGGVADPMEVVIDNVNVHLDSSENPRFKYLQRNLINFFGMFIDNVHNAQISPRGQKSNMLAFCCADQISREAFSKWHELEGYDAIVKIKSAYSLIKAIALADDGAEKRLGPLAMLDYIQYKDFPLDLFDDLRPPEFIKERGQFSWQSEVRCVFLPELGSEENTPYTLHVPGLASLIEVVALPPEWLIRRG